MTAVICTYPLDVVRARLAYQVKGEQRYHGIVHAFRTIRQKVTCHRCTSLTSIYWKRSDESLI